MSKASQAFHNNNMKYLGKLITTESSIPNKSAPESFILSITSIMIKESVYAYTLFLTNI